ncbi:MAG: glycosyltransferase [Clostridiaceae bacterium]|nr:glycosyltransferase [Clostridiaceae bacterium]
MPSPSLISVVTPVYLAEACLEELCRRLGAALSAITPDFEIIMVEDASPDGSWEVVQRVVAMEPRCKGIRLARNFGQHYAITAGLEHASGEWVVVMDCDLQDQPEEIGKLLQTARDGDYDVVFGRRVHRRDSRLKRLTSKTFYAVYNFFTDSQFDNTVANFSISRRPVIQEFLRMREHNRSFPLFIRWLGFAVGYVEVAHAERFAGKTSYTLRKLLRLSAETYDRSWVIVTSDHGHHGFRLPGKAHRHVPFLVKAPGSRCAQAVGSELPLWQLGPFFRSVFAGQDVEDCLRMLPRPLACPDTAAASEEPGR